MQLSIVSTLYHSSEYLREFYRRVKNSAEAITNQYEIILVNDGSPDDSLDVALEIHRRDNRVKVINLSRNFGHHKAMLCGLSHSQGEKVFFIDCDLEESPEWLVDFNRQMVEEQCDVVYGLQHRRKGKWFERLSGYVFYKMFNFLSNIKTDPNRTSAILMKKEYVSALSFFKEKEPVFLGISILAGFKQSSQYVYKKSKGKTTYTLSKRIVTFINLVTSFSSKPLISIFYIGVLIFSCSFLYTLYLFLYKVFFSKPLDGWTSIMMSIWLLGGLIIIFIGVVGIYLSRIFIETKQRPNVVIKEIHKT